MKLVAIVVRKAKSLIICIQNFIRIPSFKVSFNVIVQYVENGVMGSVMIFMSDSYSIITEDN